MKAVLHSAVISHSRVDSPRPSRVYYVVIRFVSLLLSLGVLSLYGASAPRACTASIPLGSIQLMVESPGQQPLPLREVNRILPGCKIRYEPRKLGTEEEKEAEIALVISPANDKELIVLPPKPAREPLEWEVTTPVELVALVFGPQGLSGKKVDSLLRRDKEMVAQLADYAEQTAQTEALIEALTATNSRTTSRQNLDAVLTGFAARYGVPMTTLDRNAPLEEQASVLLRAINPALSTYDPLAPQPHMRVQQSAGLAASVAGLFLGNSVGLAAGGAALFVNLRSLLFPNTEFRSSFAQIEQPDDPTIALCAKREAARSKTRIAYLWAHRVPNAPPPAVAFDSEVHIPLGLKYPVKARSEEWKLLDRVRNWQLEREDGSTAIPVSVRPLVDQQALEIDLSKVTLAPGVFRLTGRWDWNVFNVPGKVHLHQLPNEITISRRSQDRLITNTGTVPVELNASNLQFVQKLVLRDTERTKEIALAFDKPAAPTPTLTARIDTTGLKPGMWLLQVAQVGENSVEVPVKVLPPVPVLANTPLRINQGETSQFLQLEGTGLERIQALEADAADVKLDGTKMVASLRQGVAPGLYDLRMHVEGISEPIILPKALRVAGPRPKILDAQISLPTDLSIAPRPGELPAGAFTSIALRVENAGTAMLRLECGESKHTLRPGEQREGMRLSATSGGALFLSLDPAAAGPVGCPVKAIIEDNDTGSSDPKELGSVIRLPRLESFTLTDELIGESVFAGTIKGFDLELLEKTGWDESNGQPVTELPAPVAGEGQKQMLRVGLRWPSPTPRAPLYVWLRGDTAGRQTRLRY